jgi:hypothetical protein
VSRIINVTAGAAEYLVATVTERNGESLAATTFEVGLSSSRTEPPDTWQDPDVTTIDGATAEVSLLVDDVAQVGDYLFLWVRATDSPEVLPLVCTNAVVSVV